MPGDASLWLWPHVCAPAVMPSALFSFFGGRLHLPYSRDYRGVQLNEFKDMPRGPRLNFPGCS